MMVLLNRTISRGTDEPSRLAPAVAGGGSGPDLFSVPPALSVLHGDRRHPSPADACAWPAASTLYPASGCHWPGRQGSNRHAPGTRPRSVGRYCPSCPCPWNRRLSLVARPVTRFLCGGCSDGDVQLAEQALG